MSHPLPFRSLAIRAVAASSLRDPAKVHGMMLIEMADWTTGVGFISQEELGRSTNKSERTARRLELEFHTPESPIRVDRTPMARAEGRGRRSAYRIVLVEPRPTGHQLSGSSDVQPDTSCPGEASTTNRTDSTTNRTKVDDQPDKKPRPTGHVGGRLSVDQKIRRSIRRSCAPQADARQVPLALEDQDPGPAKKAEPTSKPRAKRAPKATAKPKRKKPKRKRPSVPEGSHARVTKHYHQAFKGRNGAEPTWGPKEGELVWTLLGKLASLEDPAGEACRRIDNMFSASWVTSPTFDLLAASPDRFIAANGRGAPRQPNRGVDVWATRPPVVDDAQESLDLAEVYGGGE